tara:strand:- start:8774 stop:8956 length:183 start_codon:yes stop_codon:yes gene_type:complete
MVKKSFEIMTAGVHAMITFIFMTLLIVGINENYSGYKIGLLFFFFVVFQMLIELFGGDNQ